MKTATVQTPGRADDGLSFWRRVSVLGPDECWPWIGPMSPDGYGQAYDGKRSIQAHRLAYRYGVGEIPTGLWVLHSCDNRRCQNPAHLSAGTPTDNQHGMSVRGRARNGHTLLIKGTVNRWGNS